MKQAKRALWGVAITVAGVAVFAIYQYVTQDLHRKPHPDEDWAWRGKGPLAHQPGRDLHDQEQTEGAQGASS